MTDPHETRPVTREEAADMQDAHAEGYHADLPRESCPDCEDRPLRSYPTLADWENRPAGEKS